MCPMFDVFDRLSYLGSVRYLLSSILLRGIPRIGSAATILTICPIFGKSVALIVIFARFLKLFTYCFLLSLGKYYLL